MQRTFSIVGCVSLALTTTILGWSLSLAEHNPGHKGKGGGGSSGSAPYRIVDLMGLTGVYSGGTFVQSTANAVSEPLFGSTLVVGSSWKSNGDGTFAGNRLHPVLWEVDANGDFVVSDLGLPPGAKEATASDVNDWGAITINTLQPADAIRAWVDVPGLPLQELPTNAQFVRAHAINNSGTIVGSGQLHAGRGLIWQLDPGGTPSNSVSLGLFYSWDIDESGTMAGYEREFAIDAPAIAWFDDNGTLQVEHLVPPDPDEWWIAAPQGEATAISPNGMWVAGWLFNFDTLMKEAFLWSDVTGMITLGRLGGEESVALGVNDAGQVVGWSNTNDRKHPRARTAFLWDAGQMFDLNALAATGRQIQLMEANAINNAGHVVGIMGVSHRGDSEEHAFLLIPNGQ